MDVVRTMLGAVEVEWFGGERRPSPAISLQAPSGHHATDRHRRPIFVRRPLLHAVHGWLSTARPSVSPSTTWPGAWTESSRRA